MTQNEANMIARAIVREWRRVTVPAGEELLTIEEVAALLKVSVSYATKHAKEFPRVKIGGNVRYPKSRLLRQLLV